MYHFNDYRLNIDKLLPQIKELTDLSLTERASLAVNCLYLGNLAPRDTLWGHTLRIYQDLIWQLDGRPYYNVHPKLVEDLVRCELENIPSSLLETPGGYDSVLIRFCQASRLLTYRAGTAVKAIMITKAGAGPVKYGDFAGLGSNGSRLDQVVWDRHMTVSIYLTHEPGQDDWDVFTTFIDQKTGLNLEEAYIKSMSDFRTLSISDLKEQRVECFRNCLRLVSTLSFLANTPDSELMEFDVLSKDREKFRNSDEAVRTALITKAKRRGKNGWNVGTNELFLPDDYQPSTSVQSDWQGGEHSHAHIRRGHIHLVRYGKGREKVKAKWFRPTIVRPDLPFLDSSRKD